MALAPLPLRYSPREQEDLIWWATESDGALGRKSIQGSIQARLEGSQGGYEEPDLVTDPEAAFKSATGKIGFFAAGRIKRIERAWKSCSSQNQLVISAVWMTPLHKGLEAFGHWANLVVLSEEAKKISEKARCRIPLVEWLNRLSTKKVGVLKEGRVLSQNAKKSELDWITAINRDCEKSATRALRNFVGLYRPVDN